MAPGNFLRCRHLHTLAFLDGMNELAGFQHRFMGTGIQPGEAPPHGLDIQAALLKIEAVQIGDLKLAACRGLDALGQLDHIAVVKIQAGDGIARFGGFGFFFQADGFALGIEFDHAIALGVVDGIGKHRGPRFALGCAFEQGGEVVAVKDVVAQHQGGRIVADKGFANEEGLRQAVRRGLHRIAQVDAPAAAVAQQFRKAWGVVRGGNDQDVADARQQQGA